MKKKIHETEPHVKLFCLDLILISMHRTWTFLFSSFLIFVFLIPSSSCYPPPGPSTLALSPNTSHHRRLVTIHEKEEKVRMRAYSWISIVLHFITPLPPLPPSKKPKTKPKQNPTNTHTHTHTHTHTRARTRAHTHEKNPHQIEE